MGKVGKISWVRRKIVRLNVELFHPKPKLPIQQGGGSIPEPDAEFMKETKKILSDPSVGYISLGEFIKSTKSAGGYCQGGVLNKWKAFIKFFKDHWKKP